MTLEETNRALFEAVEQNNVPWLHYLIEREDANVHARGGDGLTALHRACKTQGHLTVVRYLLEAAAATGSSTLDMTVNAHAKYGWTALHYASDACNLDVARCLMETGVLNVEAISENGWTALHVASAEGHLDMVKFLVETAAAKVEAQTSFGRSALHLSSAKGHLPTVQFLMETSSTRRDININATDDKGFTALHMACERADLAVVQCLVETGQGVHVNAQSDDGDTALHVACRSGHLPTVQFLVETGRGHQGANIQATNKNGETALHIASYWEYLPIVQFLVETFTRRGIHVNAIDNMGCTALHIACQGNSLALVQCLVEAGRADVNATTNNGTTALLLAALRQNGFNDRIIQYLVQTGQVTNFEASNEYGETALHYACRFGSLATVRCMMESGRCQANAHALTSEGRSVLHFASSHGRFDVLQYLVDTCRVDERVTDATGQTALHVACECRHVRIILYLIQRYPV